MGVVMPKELRKEMIKGVIEEIRGPRYGPQEVIEYDPWDEYLIGTTIPIDWKNRSERNKSEDKDEILYNDLLETEMVDDVDFDNSEDNNSENIVNSLSANSILNPNSQIRSFGVSFSVEGESPNIEICATWARYFKDLDSEEAYSLKGEIVKRNEDIEDIEDEEAGEGNKSDSKKEKMKPTFWKRESFGYIKSVTINDECLRGKEIILEGGEKEDNIKLYIKSFLVDENKLEISVYLMNNLKPDYSNKRFRVETEECLFQPSLRICLDEKSILGMDTLVESNNELDFLYKEKQVVGSGHLTSVIWKDIDYCREFDEDLLWPEGRILTLTKNSDFEKFFKPSIRSEFVPLYPINLPKFDLENIDLILEAETLANSTQDELYVNLNKLVDAYSTWIEENEKEAERLKKENKLSSSEIEIIYGDTNKKGLLDKQKEARDRIKEGIKLICSEDLVYLAFCFANKTISLQNEWDKEYRGVEKDFEWRTFQLAFILMNLESIFNENSKNKEVLDLLWIPTGGGKTEAYLGIMAFTMALRRLKARFGVTDEKTGAGVSIISRYTLRLLTVQQFRRTLKMVTAAECLRVWENNDNIGWRPEKCSLEDDWIYGSVRFSVGMWVGGSVTPLHLNKNNNSGEPIGAMGILKFRENVADGATGNPAQIIKCPVCGSWLSIPEEDGLTDEENHVHLVVEAQSKERLENILDSMIELKDIKHQVSNKNLKSNYYAITLIIEGQYSPDDYKLLINAIFSEVSEKDPSFKFKSLNISNPGYFTSRKKLGERKETETDFEIWCTNPECKLNHFWKEGAPISDSEFKFPDGNHERYIESPFEENKRIPIPAYLIDEHVYFRCPTVIVSTADKIARLAFQPRAGSIFGNIDGYNKYYGYYRNGLFPERASKPLTRRDNKEINRLYAPDLIIQDELHLMDGPLGSLFGLYEAVVSFLIEDNEGKPKYIASTATINNAQKQVNLLFAKNLSQFPPYGLTISDSFFVKDEVEDENDYQSFNKWNEKNKGRVYLGIYSTGLGHFTHQVRIYSRLLKLGQDLHNEENFNYYWTLVGYYSAIKHLGSAVALYKDDIVSRVKQISVLDNMRSLNPEDDKIELSSRMDSTELPLILEKLERDGHHQPNTQYNAIFTTSMFGTGVDISHLSTMIINSQPKTTGSYIQASGRVGRSYGGLIVDLLVSGRIRDLNHYEMFSSYHSRLYREVEPVSVSPFSKGCLSKGLGPSLVAFLRNAKHLKCDWWDDDAAKVILEENAKDDIQSFYNLIRNRLLDISANSVNINYNVGDMLKFFDCEVEKWIETANKVDKLYYSEPTVVQSEINKDIVLGDPEHQKNPELNTVYKNSPQSLREVEDTLGFWV